MRRGRERPDTGRCVLITMDRGAALFAASVAEECGFAGVLRPDGPAALEALVASPASFAAAVIGADEPTEAARLARSMLSVAPGLTVLFIAKPPARPEWGMMNMYGQLSTGISPFVLESALSDKP